MRWAPLLALAFCCLAAGEDARSIIQKSVDNDQWNWQHARDYTFHQRETQLEMGKDDQFHEKQSETFDITILYGRPFRRLIERNGEPLSPKDEQKEQARFDKEVAKRRRESEQEQSRLAAEYEKERVKQRAFLREVVNAYNFSLTGMDQVDGHAAYVITADPRPDFHPHDSRAKILPKLRVKLWIDKQSYDWVKVDADVIKTFTWGFFVLRLNPGSHLHFEQQRVNDEIWLPSRMVATVNARLFGKKVEIQFADRDSDYRKFQTDVKMLRSY